MGITGKKVRPAGLAAACVVLLAVEAASATPITFSGAAESLSASAKFEASGGNLIVTLTNTSAADVLKPPDVLSAVFFDIDAPEPVNLLPLSAVLGTGASVIFGMSEPGGAVGGEWAYAANLIGAPGGAGYGISSAAFGLFGPHDLFGGANLQGPTSPAGLQYGITAAGDDPTTGNKPVTGKNALIHSEVVFTLSGLPSGFDPYTQISNVVWQYGTSLHHPHFPEPGTLVLLMMGALATIRRRR
jgi:hypothetical protein